MLHDTGRFKNELGLLINTTSPTYHNVKLKRLQCVKMSPSLYACYACGECGGLLITSVAQIYFIFPQLPFPGWLGGGEAVNNIQWASPYTQIQGNYYLSMFSFCSQEENQFCGELRGKGHKEDICLVRYPSHCERRPNKRCMAAFAILHHLETKYNLHFQVLKICHISQTTPGELPNS